MLKKNFNICKKAISTNFDQNSLRIMLRENNIIHGSLFEVKSRGGQFMRIDYGGFE